MRINIFRNRNIDAQVGYFLDVYDYGLRKQTEDYWRNAIAIEIQDACPDYAESNYPCPDCVEYMSLIRGGRK